MVSCGMNEESDDYEWKKVLLSANGEDGKCHLMLMMLENNANQ